MIRRYTTIFLAVLISTLIVLQPLQVASGMGKPSQPPTEEELIEKRKNLKISISSGSFTTEQTLQCQTFVTLPFFATGFFFPVFGDYIADLALAADWLDPVIAIAAFVFGLYVGKLIAEMSVTGAIALAVAKVITGIVGFAGLVHCPPKIISNGQSSFVGDNVDTFFDKPPRPEQTLCDIIVEKDDNIDSVDDIPEGTKFICDKVFSDDPILGGIGKLDANTQSIRIIKGNPDFLTSPGGECSKDFSVDKVELFRHGDFGELDVQMDAVYPPTFRLAFDGSERWETDISQVANNIDNTHTIFTFDDGPHPVQFSVFNVNAPDTRDVRNLVTHLIRILEPVQPVVTPGPPHSLEAFFPGGTILPQGFEDLLIEEAIFLDDCTPTDKLKKRTNLHSFLGPTGFLPLGIHDVSIFVRDRSGNENEPVTVQITVRDSIAPDILPLDDVGVEIPRPESDISGSTLLDDGILVAPQTFDLVTLNPTITCTANIAGSDVLCEDAFFPLGITDVTWTAIDFFDNENSIMQKVSVKKIGDNNPPLANDLPLSNEPTKLVAKGIETEIIITGSDPDFDPLKFILTGLLNFGGFVGQDEATFQTRLSLIGKISELNSFQIESDPDTDQKFITVADARNQRLIVFNTGTEKILANIDLSGNNITPNVNTGKLANGNTGYVADWNANKIYKYTISGQNIFQIDDIIDTTSFRLVDPQDMVVGGSGSQPILYILDRIFFTASEIKEVNAVTKKLTKTWFNSREFTAISECNANMCPTGFSHPIFLVADWTTGKAHVIILDPKQGTNAKILNCCTWDLSDLLKEPPGGIAPLVKPSGILADLSVRDEENTLFVADAEILDILKVRIFEGGSGHGATADLDVGARFVDVKRIESDNAGNLYVLDKEQFLKFNLFGSLLKVSFDLEIGSGTGVRVFDFSTDANGNMFILTNTPESGSTQRGLIKLDSNFGGTGERRGKNNCFDVISGSFNFNRIEVVTALEGTRLYTTLPQDGLQKWTDSCQLISNVRDSSFGAIDVDSDPTGNFIYVLTNQNKVHKLDLNGNQILEFGGTGTGNGLFQNAQKILVNALGNVYVAEPKNTNNPVPKMQKFSSTGEFLGFAVPDGTPGDLESFLQKGDFTDIEDVAAFGNTIFVAEGAPLHRIHFFDGSPFTIISNTAASTIFKADSEGVAQFKFKTDDLFSKSDDATVTLTVSTDRDAPIIGLEPGSEPIIDPLKLVRGDFVSDVNSKQQIVKSKAEHNLMVSQIMQTYQQVYKENTGESFPQELITLLKNRAALVAKMNDASAPLDISWAQTNSIVYPTLQVSNEIRSDYFINKINPFNKMFGSWNENNDFNSVSSPTFIGSSESCLPPIAIEAKKLVDYAPNIFYGDSTLSMGNIEVVDVNGDANQDVIASTAFGFSVFIGNGLGGFDQIHDTTHPDFPDVFPARLATGDFNGDGHPDIAISTLGGGDPSTLPEDETEGNISIFLNKADGSGEFELFNRIPLEVFEISVEDLNNDGASDIVTGIFPNLIVFLNLNDGTGNFDSGTKYPTSIGGFYDHAFGDFNDDGHIDIAGVTTFPSRVAVFLNNEDGTGEFEELIEFTVGDINDVGLVSSNGMTLGDFNNDGSVDIVIANNIDESLSILLNKADQSGQFESVKEIQLGLNHKPMGVAVDDLNSDGNQDIVVVGDFRNSDEDIIILLGDGNGEFSETSNFEQVGFPFFRARVSDVKIADFNSDGKQDLATGDLTNGLSVSLADFKSGVRDDDFIISLLVDLVIATDEFDKNPSLSNDIPEILSLGNNEIIFTATDASLNEGICPWSITVRDTTAPQITAPKSAIKDVTGVLTILSAEELGLPTVSDIVDPFPDVTNNAPAEGFPVGITNVVWTATDATGNSANAIQKVTIRDPDPPTITNVPDDFEEEAINGYGNVFNFESPEASDLGGLSQDIECDPLSGTAYPIGMTPVLCSAVDNANLFAFDMFTVNFVASDDDSDSVINILDDEPNSPVPSPLFSDVSLGGKTTGFVQTQGDQNLIVIDGDKEDGGVILRTEAGGFGLNDDFDCRDTSSGEIIRGAEFDGIENGCLDSDGNIRSGLEELIDEDPKGDANGDGAPGILGIDDDGDGMIDEGNVNDDDEDGLIDEDPGIQFGPRPAVISSCDSSVLVSLRDGDEAGITCGSAIVESISGSFEVEFKINEDTTASTTVNEGDTLNFDSEELIITSSPESSGANIITVDGKTFQLDPGGTVKIAINPNGDPDLSGSILVLDEVESFSFNPESNFDEILIESIDYELSTIFIPNEITEPKINYKNVVTTNTDGLPQVFVNPQLLVDSESSGVPFNVFIPAESLLIGTPEWNGVLNLPTVKSTSSVQPLPEEPDQTTTVTSVIELGFNEIPLSLSIPAQLTFEGRANERVVITSAGITNEVTDICKGNTLDDNLDLPNDGECKISIGENLFVWTNHLSLFSTFTVDGGSTPTITPAEAIQLLIDDVDALVESGKLDARTARALQWLLGAALTLEEGEDHDGAVSKLQSFNSRLNLFVGRGMVSSDIGQPLMDFAQVIIESDPGVGIISPG